MLSGKTEAPEDPEPSGPSLLLLQFPHDSLTSHDFFQNIQNLDSVQCCPHVKMLDLEWENKNYTQSGKVGHVVPTFNHSTQNQRQANLCEFKASLIDTASSRTVRAT